MRGHFLRTAEMLLDMPADGVPLAQLGRHNLGFHRFQLRPTRRLALRLRACWGARRLGRRLWLGLPRLLCLALLLLLGLGLRFGLSPHLGNAAEKIFDFVFHRGSWWAQPTLLFLVGTAHAT